MEEKPCKKKKKVFESYTIRALSESEYKLMLTKCNTLEDEILIRLAVENGLRRIDISKVELGNVQGEKLIYFEHKKRRSLSVPLSPGLAQRIEQYKKTLPKNTKYLFSWGKSPHGDSTAWRRFQKLCELTGIDGRPFHCLRGTCIKLLQKKGWSLNEVAKLIGDDPATVQLYYATTSDFEIAEKMRGLE
jgi:integrase